MRLEVNGRMQLTGSHLGTDIRIIQRCTPRGTWIPVPKCFPTKKTRCGILRKVTLFVISGNDTALMHDKDNVSQVIVKGFVRQMRTEKRHEEDTKHDADTRHHDGVHHFPQLLECVKRRPWADKWHSGVTAELLDAG